mgnify:FL=1
MQYAFIITKIDSYLSESGGEIFCLNVIDHQERTVSLYGVADQQINIQALKGQVLPVVMLSDHVDLPITEKVTIPPTALVSIVPIAANAIDGVLAAGKAEDILQSLSLKSC